MSEDANTRYRLTCARLNGAIADCTAKINLSQQNMQLKASCTEKLNRHKKNLYLVNRVIEQVKPCIADVKEYLAERKRQSLLGINNSIRLASEIVPNAMCEVHLEIEDNGDAYVASQDSIDMNILEGGGYRQILSSFIQSVILAANQSYLQILILDEKYALLNEEYSADLSSYLNVMGQSQQIISIEQKKAVYSNTPYLEYNLVKGDLYTSVTRTQHDL